MEVVMLEKRDLMKERESLIDKKLPEEYIKDMSELNDLSKKVAEISSNILHQETLLSLSKAVNQYDEKVIEMKKKYGKKEEAMEWIDG
jgi:hypothetical protein